MRTSLNESGTTPSANVGGATSSGGNSGQGVGGNVAGGKGTGGTGRSGGLTGSATGGANGSGGSTSSRGACGTTNGTYSETTIFQIAGSTAPYTLNTWGTWGDGTTPILTQTTTGPDGLDCSSGCAKLTIDFSRGTKQYAAGSFVEYFGTATNSVENLLNQTISAKIAVAVQQPTGADTAVPITISLFGQDTYESTNGVDNLWVKNLGSASSLDAALGWHTVTFKVLDAQVPSWSPTRTVCASALHAIGISIQNYAAIDGTNGGVVILYVQSVLVSPPS